jgi:hypothetical protein
MKVIVDRLIYDVMAGDDDAIKVHSLSVSNANSDGVALTPFGH